MCANSYLATDRVRCHSVVIVGIFVFSSRLQYPVHAASGSYFPQWTVLGGKPYFKGK